ncbi:hypothetical protein EVAR_78707_1 [Eumeta japonica]|uniref:Uncharacterized protein n=1 Tax=Eumeta variegata TaxID=151549 RepID=A0A4C1T142_EUMVA|nr:hypothetical protein EVAR_78707_1 [Eumeta japonica]
MSRCHRTAIVRRLSDDVKTTWWGRYLKEDVHPAETLVDTIAHSPAVEINPEVETPGSQIGIRGRTECTDLHMARPLYIFLAPPTSADSFALARRFLMLKLRPFFNAPPVGPA